MAIALGACCHAQRSVYRFACNAAVDRVCAAELASRALRIGGDSPTLIISGHALACARELS
jgi:hypothetical protein